MMPLSTLPPVVVGSNRYVGQLWAFLLATEEPNRLQVFYPELLGIATSKDAADQELVKVEDERFLERP